jgi:hypothetical protein
MDTDSRELVRRAYEEWNWYGTEAFSRFLSDDVTLEDAPALPDAGTWRGREAVIARLDAVAETIGGGWVEIRSIEPLEGRLLVEMEWRLDDKREGVPVGEVFHLIGLDQGKLASIRVFESRREAESAAASE